MGAPVICLQINKIGGWPDGTEGRLCYPICGAFPIVFAPSPQLEQSAAFVAARAARSVSAESLPLTTTREMIKSQVTSSELSQLKHTGDKEMAFGCYSIQDSPVHIDIVAPRARYAYVFGIPFMPFPSYYAEEMYFTLAISFLSVQVAAYSEAAGIERVGFSFGGGDIYWDSLAPYTCWCIPYYGMYWQNLTVVAYDEAGYYNAVSLGIAGIGFSSIYGYGEIFYDEKAEVENTLTEKKLKEILAKVTFNREGKKLSCGEKVLIKKAEPIPQKASVVMITQTRDFPCNGT